MIIKYNSLLIKNYLLFMFSLNSYYVSFLGFFFFKYHFFFNSFKSLAISNIILLNCKIVEFVNTRVKKLIDKKKKYLILNTNKKNIDYANSLWLNVSVHSYFISRLI